jgi:hypothetical protein
LWFPAFAPAIQREGRLNSVISDGNSAALSSDAMSFLSSDSGGNESIVREQFSVSRDGLSGSI